MTTSEMLARQHADTREWTLKLVADLSGEEWILQPGDGIQHPLWICGHLATAEEALVFNRCLGQGSVLDAEFKKHFAIGSPIQGADAAAMPSPKTVLATAAEMHAKTLKAIRGMSDDLLEEPAYAADGSSRHPHYADKLGVVCHLSRHEAFHAGQLALIRRVMGKSFLR